MKVVVLHGSARSGGDSDTLAAHVLDGLGGAGSHDVLHFRPSEMEIAHCRGCMGCRDGSGCVIMDDMQAVYPAFCDAQIVILAAPMFWGYMTSQLKTLFDRLEAVADATCFGGKDFVLLITYRHFFGSMVTWLERISAGFGSRCHSLTCRTYDPETGKDIPAHGIADALDEAFRLGRSLVGK
ncbi:MAG: flavodoxin family protein [Candidatus Bipolaricaulota bacterium]|nr:MAG: flavodoxin family protein [Candidatus Bipolaricaulota bacterium]